jgi:hypothetical protein
MYTTTTFCAYIHVHVVAQLVEHTRVYNTEDCELESQSWADHNNAKSNYWSPWKVHHTAINVPVYCKLASCDPFIPRPSSHEYKQNLIDHTVEAPFRHRAGGCKRLDGFSSICSSPKESSLQSPLHPGNDSIQRMTPSREWPTKGWKGFLKVHVLHVPLHSGVHHGGNEITNG